VAGETLIATFNATTGWTGRRITFTAGSFLLDGHGPVAAADVLAYGQRGQLDWAHDGMRTWVAQLAARQASAAPQPRPPWQPAGVRRSTGRPTALKAALIVIGILLVCGIVVMAAVVAFVHQREKAQATWHTYTNARGAYRISCPLTFREAPYTTRVGDPGTNLRFVDIGGSISSLTRRELATTVIVCAKRLDKPLSPAAARQTAELIAQRVSTISGDDPQSGMWDRRTIKATVATLHGLPCAVHEFTYRNKLGGREHDLVYQVFSGSRYYLVQLGAGASSWDRDLPLLLRIRDSFATL